MPPALRVAVWVEHVHERKNAIVRAIYRKGCTPPIAAGLREEGKFAIRTATLEQPKHGLATSDLEETDVLVWWGHSAHGEVADEVVGEVLRRVWEGMGFIALHSAHFCQALQTTHGHQLLTRLAGSGRKRAALDL